MEPVVILLLVGIAIRIVLDLSSMTRPGYAFDACYTVLFFIVGLVEIAVDHQDIFGYASIALAAMWGAVGLYRYKKQRGPPHNDPHCHPHSKA